MGVKVNDLDMLQPNPMTLSEYQWTHYTIPKLDITKYPPIAIPAHTGITMFDPEIYEHFRRLVSLEVESSFENVVCPVITKENRLFAINIPTETWIPVNDLKGLEQASTALSRLVDNFAHQDL